LEPSNKSDVLDIALERLQKQSPVASSTIKPVIDRPVVQASSALDVSSGLNLTTSTPGSELKAPLLTDKPVIQLNTPVNNASWGDSFNQRIHWLVNQSVSGAEIRLNPQHMGPVEVRIQMQNDQATVSFTAQHAATKEAT
jgi:Flagellar hook-length control protein